MPWFDGTYRTIKLAYQQSTMNTFVIYYDNTMLCTYHDWENAAWVQSAGTYWGFHASTGGATFTLVYSTFSCVFSFA
jgi:hypothetical protein